MYVATERGTSDNPEATRFSQSAYDQRRRLEAEDCNSIRCAQLISGGRRRIRPPRCLAHARPTMCCSFPHFLFPRFLFPISSFLLLVQPGRPAGHAPDSAGARESLGTRLGRTKVPRKHARDFGPGDHNHQRYWFGSRYFGPGSRFTLGESITLCAGSILSLWPSTAL